jgi:hypothetical protein
VCDRPAEILGVMAQEKLRGTNHRNRKTTRKIPINPNLVFISSNLLFDCFLNLLLKWNRIILDTINTRRIIEGANPLALKGTLFGFIEEINQAERIKRTRGRARS